MKLKWPEVKIEYFKKSDELLIVIQINGKKEILFQLKMN